MARTPAVIEVAVAAEWGAHPLWITADDDPTPLNLPPRMWADYLPITSELVSKFETWDSEFHGIFNPTDPLASEFPSEEAEEAWDAHGREITEELARILGPDVQVRYYKEVIQAGSASRERNDD